MNSGVRNAGQRSGSGTLGASKTALAPPPAPLDIGTGGAALETPARNRDRRLPGARMRVDPRPVLRLVAVAGLPEAPAPRASPEPAHPGP